MSEQDRNRSKARYYSGKKPYLTHNYRTMMKKKTQEEYYFHELNLDPMSELLKPYWNKYDIDGGFPRWEYLSPDWDWTIPPGYGGPGGYAGGDLPDDDPGGGGTGCAECEILGDSSVECGDAWVGFVHPSQCTGFIQFALGMGGAAPEDFGAEGNDFGFIVVAIPDDTDSTSFLVCNSQGVTGVTCCKEVAITCDPCCREFTVSGNGTQNPNTTWFGAIDPPCPGATGTVDSNSGCSGYPKGVTVNAAGTLASFSIAATDCGTLTVTITEPFADPECTKTAGAGIRINNTGQGGGWVAGAQCTISPPDDVGCDAPFIGFCYKTGAGINGNCIIGVNRWVYSYQRCHTDLPGGNPCLSGCALVNCPTSCASAPCFTPATNTRRCPCSGAGKSGYWWDSRVDSWSCVCP